MEWDPDPTLCFAPAQGTWSTTSVVLGPTVCVTQGGKGQDWLPAPRTQLLYSLWTSVLQIRTAGPEISPILVQSRDLGLSTWDMRTAFLTREGQASICISWILRLREKVRDPLVYPFCPFPPLSNSRAFRDRESLGTGLLQCWIWPTQESFKV